jgi:F-type H+-transporting ATPase subunit b
MSQRKYSICILLICLGIFGLNRIFPAASKAFAWESFTGSGWALTVRNPSPEAEVSGRNSSQGGELPASQAHAQPNTEVKHKAESGGHHEPGMFDFNVWILISQTINFFVLLYLLKKVLYGPINSIIEERKRKIQKDLENAELENKKGMEFKAEYEKRLGAVEQEAYQIKKKALSEAASAKEEIIAAAKANAEKLIEKAQKEIILERQKAWVELREEVVKLAMLGAEKVIEKSLDDPTHHALIRKAIEEVEKR